MISPGSRRRSSTMLAVEDANGRPLFSYKKATDQVADYSPGCGTSPSRIMRCSTTCR